MYLNDIRYYAALDVNFSPNLKPSPSLSKQSDMQVVRKDVPIVSIEVKLQLAEKGDDLRHQEAHLLK